MPALAKPGTGQAEKKERERGNVSVWHQTFILLPETKIWIWNLILLLQFSLEFQFSSSRWSLFGCLENNANSISCPSTNYLNSIFAVKYKYLIFWWESAVCMADQTTGFSVTVKLCQRAEWRGWGHRNSSPLWEMPFFPLKYFLFDSLIWVGYDYVSEQWVRNGWAS